MVTESGTRDCSRRRSMSQLLYPLAFSSSFFSVFYLWLAAFSPALMSLSSLFLDEHPYFFVFFLPLQLNKLGRYDRWFGLMIFFCFWVTGVSLDSISLPSFRSREPPSCPFDSLRTLLRSAAQSGTLPWGLVRLDDFAANGTAS